MESRRLDELAAELIVEIARNLWLGDMSNLAQANRRLYQITDPFLYLTDARPYNQYALLWAARHNLPTVAERALRAGTPALTRCGEPSFLRPFGPVVSTCEELDAVIPSLPRPPCWTPLDIATCEGHAEVVALLLRHLQPIESFDMTVAIGRTASKGQVETTDVILRHAQHLACERVADLVETAFCAAASAGQRAVLERLLEEKDGPATVDRSAQYYRTSMMEAAGTGHDAAWDLLSSVQPLSELDANPVTQYQQLLHYLSMDSFGNGSRGVIELVEKFISLGLDLTREREFSSLLEAACRRGNVRLVEMLLNYSANEKRDREVLFSNFSWYTDVCKMLLARGIPRSICEEGFRDALSARSFSRTSLCFPAIYTVTEGMTDYAGVMLHLACDAASLEFVQLVLSVGTVQERKEKAEWQWHGRRPLQVLMKSGREKERLNIARVLLDAGADPNKCGVLELKGDSPLNRACEKRLPRVAQLLLEYGADPELHRGNGSILQTACLECPDVALIEDLLKRGADATARTLGGLTPLHQLGLANTVKVTANQNARYEIAKLLIAHGADPDAETSIGATPLHFASLSTPEGASLEDAAVVLALLEHGADIEKRSDGGFGPPLHLACGAMNIWAASILLAQGARISPHTISAFRGKHWDVASDISADGYMHETMKLLLAYGADKAMVREAMLLPLSQGDGRTYEAMRLLLMRVGAPDKDTRIILHRNDDRLRVEALGKALGMVLEEHDGGGVFDPEKSVMLYWPREEKEGARWMEGEDEDVLYD